MTDNAVAMTIAEANLADVTIEHEMRTSYLSYAMSVIVSRALPDVRDGLKPVQRRILYAMHDMGIRPGSQHRKSARIVGEVLGKFHPHGDSSVYDALVRMAQQFSMRSPLVDGQGNFGSIDGDPPAAMRYTEARLATVADAMLADIDEQTVDRRPNFDDSMEEPVVLPARLPNLLINGSSGIAVGMATNMPPHCPSEICDAVCLLIDEPDAGVDRLMECVPGPDFPTRAVIRGTEGIRDIYANGRGRVVVEAVTSIEERRNGRQRIVVSELPYQVNKATLVEKIASLVKDKTVTGISEIRDESDRRGIRIVLELARAAQPNVILNNLFRRTQLRATFNAIMLALVDGQPQELSLRSLLTHFIDHRAEVIRRRTEFRLRRAEDRAHIVEGLLNALDAIDRVIELIRGSDTVEAARNALTEQLSLSEQQAQAILDMQLRRLAALERQRLEEELNELRRLIDELRGLLADDERIKQVIKEETVAIKERYGDERRTRIESEAVIQQSERDFIVDENVVVTLSQRGYLKRMPIDTYRTQRRGGKGVKGSDQRDDDTLMQVEVMSTHDRLLFFTNQGRVYPLNVHQAPAETSRSTRGTLLINLIGLQEGERVQTMLPVRHHMAETLFVLATRQGRFKAIETQELENLTSKGMRITLLSPDDEIISVRTATPDSEIITVTQSGQANMFSLSSVRPQKRAASGVVGMRMREPDQMIAMDVSRSPDTDHILMVTEGGHAKATPIKNGRGERLYPLARRGNYGVRAFTVELDPKSRRYSGPIVDARVVDTAAVDGLNGHGVFIISQQGQVTRIDMKEIRVMNTRQARGVIVWKERADQDTVSSIACFRDESAPDPVEIPPQTAEAPEEVKPAAEVTPPQQPTPVAPPTATAEVPVETTSATTVAPVAAPSEPEAAPAQEKPATIAAPTQQPTQQEPEQPAAVKSGPVQLSF